MSVSRQLLRQLATRFGLVGESQAMQTAMSRLLQVAPTDLTVLITGETGTGKEVFASALHELSQRKRYPFISVNCGAIPETLLESELFGAEKGAYTGADERRKGFFEAADRGTIFLDEIGEMPMNTQVKLLRILESGEFSRLGSSTVQKVNVRVVAATNRDLLYEVKQGRFRQDLFFRLNSVNIHLPPLRQHAEDLPILAEHFAQRAADKAIVEFQGFDAAALQRLESYSWPGNIRELRNVVETMVTLERGAHVTVDLLERYLPNDHEEPSVSPTALVRVGDTPRSTTDADMQMVYRTLLQLAGDVNEMKGVLRHLLSLTFEHGNGSTSATTAVSPVVRSAPATNSNPVQAAAVAADDVDDENLNLARIERMAIELALRRTAGSRRDAAKLLGISERTLYRKIEEYGLR